MSNAVGWNDPVAGLLRGINSNTVFSSWALRKNIAVANQMKSDDS